MKSLLVILSLFAGITLYSCHGSNSSENNNASSQSNASEPSAGSSPSIDVNAPSSSQGVGKFSNVQVGSTIDAKMAEAGQEVFQTKCTACHQATNQRLIGPGLKGITKIRTPAWIMNMIVNPDTMTHADPLAEALYNEFNQTQMTNQGLTDQEVREVLEFLRQNDAK